ncbi:MAG: hypothetical protein GWO20_12125 [Candidatus Korarchaeota archaeon]|nr:hypothetical protein [Candidatus Korarchaeota archaeon]NIU84178.1 hypothetical protein [Candidatus Thorarchaeota archaeon]NIW52420.1 hypothetical protein [Candidatus Korarchaeota archaeon]
MITIEKRRKKRRKIKLKIASPLVFDIIPTRNALNKRNKIPITVGTMEKEFSC